MPNDTLAQAVARAMCGSPEICPACQEEAHGVIAAIREAGFAIQATDGPGFEAALDRFMATIAMVPEWRPSIATALRAALNQPKGETDGR